MIRFNVGEIKVDKISKSSAVFNGNRNMPSAWKSKKNVNDGFGDVTGKQNHMEGNQYHVNDNDFYDTVFPKKQNSNKG